MIILVIVDHDFDMSGVGGGNLNCVLDKNEGHLTSGPGHHDHRGKPQGNGDRHLCLGHTGAQCCFSCEFVFFVFVFVLDSRGAQYIDQYIAGQDHTSVYFPAPILEYSQPGYFCRLIFSYFLKRPMDEFPHFQSGLKVGDMILAINTASFLEISYDEVQSLSSSP